MKRFFLLFFVLVGLELAAQPRVGLLAYYSFNGNLSDVQGNSSNAGQHSGTPSFLCGIENSALSFNGGSDRVNIVGPIIDEFNVEDFSLSFSFKPVGSAGTQYLLSKRRGDCASDYSFYLRYNPSTRTLNAVMFETANKNVSLVHRLPANRCWFQVALVRDNNRIRLFVDGVQVQEGITVGRIDVSNDGDLIIGSSECLGPNEASFQGLIDDLRIYGRTLRPEEVRSLYTRPDMIQTPDTLIFLGNSVPIQLTGTCGTAFNWSPVDGVSDPSLAEPTITPTRPGVNRYSVRIADDFSGCTAVDSISINAIDPNSLDCNSIFLPNAFTPNGDGLNDNFGISNPYAVQELVSFEIFDRWGSLIFSTQNPFDRWDGSFRNTAVNPGVMLYRVVFRCNGVERLITGNVSVMR